ncbi:hypothetical protein PENFLA_c001G01190 [Penicillium flavigenum]|uniref:Zn(2)-C6 fungal-type domain-containing protein n=1 Tax=Penicillium flavigenum TaxID=254877 RepID=A0A1V6U375_9EURO|nr:hypothetical protein PENFLA_c091G04794 [Penicillium flavigenum]OQE32992.1 hypothetical protein PENFLA_c001G01190 [Penicillium flavigenum]
MPKNNILPELLPRGQGSSIRYLETDSSTKQHRRVSLACTECQKRKSKCSGTTPCTKCTTEARQCFYNPAGDRRRKAHTAELLNFRDALYRMAAKLRSGTPEEISRLIWRIQNLPTVQEAAGWLNWQRVKTWMGIPNPSPPLDNLMANNSPTDYKKLFLQAEGRRRQEEERWKPAGERGKIAEDKESFPVVWWPDGDVGQGDSIVKNVSVLAKG